MATDYAKKKNDELASLCKERGLTHTGKKADLVKRLEEHDASGATTVSADQIATTKPPVEDEIDWDDEPATDTAKAATTVPASNAIAAGGSGLEVPNPQAVPNQVPAVDPAQTDDLKVAAAPSNTASAAPATETVMEPSEAPKEGEASAEKKEKDYTSGVAERTLEEEIEKRKARARKFGLPEDTEEIKILERARRFGTSDVPGLLNKALTVSNEAGRKRGSEGPEGGVRKRTRGGRPGAGLRRGSSRQGGGEGRAPGGGASASKGLALSEKDREAAEKRRARFAAS